MFTFTRILAAALRPFGWDAAATRGRLWVADGAPTIAATRLTDGFALAVGHRELVVSRA